MRAAPRRTPAAAARRRGGDERPESRGPGPGVVPARSGQGHRRRVAGACGGGGSSESGRGRAHHRRVVPPRPAGRRPPRAGRGGGPRPGGLPVRGRPGHPGAPPPLRAGRGCASCGPGSRRSTPSCASAARGWWSARGGRRRWCPAVAAEAGADRVALTREVSPLGRAPGRPGARGARAGAGRAERARRATCWPSPRTCPGSSGRGYLVFTPFAAGVDAGPAARAPARARAPRRARPALGRAAPAARRRAAPCPPARRAARARLVEFIAGGDARALRRAPRRPGRRRHLAAVRLPALRHVHAGPDRPRPGPAGRARSAGRAAFWRQVCWREFYHHHLARHPEVRAAGPAARAPAACAGTTTRATCAAWARGETGYPVVDAGMRQLARAGMGAQPRAHDRGLVPGQGPAGGLAARARRSSCGAWSTATRPATTAAGSGRPAPAPTPRRTSAS